VIPERKQFAGNDCLSQQMSPEVIWRSGVVPCWLRPAWLSSTECGITLHVAAVSDAFLRPPVHGDLLLEMYVVRESHRNFAISRIKETVVLRFETAQDGSVAIDCKLFGTTAY
jgi:hypothetical protein